MVKVLALNKQAGFTIEEFTRAKEVKDVGEARRWLLKALPSLHIATTIALSRREPPSRLRHLSLSLIHI